MSDLELFLKELDPTIHHHWIDDRTLIIKRWNWEYAEAHAFQRKALSLVQEHSRLRILICCNHPQVLTHGRGLQKPRKGEILTLKEFKEQDYPTLPFPLHQIERGGGLTFHHSGQFIFYPIVKLNPSGLSLSRMTHEIFDMAANVLASWGIKNLTQENKLLGLWVKDQKIASMGIAIERLTTFHGMAINIFKDPEMMKALEILNPCGLSASTYVSAQELCPLPINPLEKFTEQFLERISHGWK
jgi:lipoyl(octanoyl) transferase